MSAEVSAQAERFATEFCQAWSERLRFQFPLEMVEDLAVRYHNRGLVKIAPGSDFQADEAIEVRKVAPEPTWDDVEKVELGVAVFADDPAKLPAMKRAVEGMFNGSTGTPPSGQAGRKSTDGEKL